MRRTVPIVAVTAYEDIDTVNKCYRIGMSAVLNKPVSADKLVKIVNKLYPDQWTENLIFDKFAYKLNNEREYL